MTPPLNEGDNDAFLRRPSTARNHEAPPGEPDRAAEAMLLRTSNNCWTSKEYLGRTIWSLPTTGWYSQAMAARIERGELRYPTKGLPR